MNKNVKWLYSELSGLIDKGVITSDTAERIRGHYGDAEQYSGRRIALTVCSILGAVLIGAGIMLLLAHNWGQLTRPVRTVLSISPLFVSQLLGLWILWKAKNSAAWCEGVGVFLSLSIGASIALVAQTYHIPGNLGGFLFVWSLLVLPVVYLLNSSLAAAIYMVGITFWSGHEQFSSRNAVLFWPLLAAAIPHIWISSVKDVYSFRSVWLRWAAALCLCAGTGIALEKTLPGLWIVVYSSMFGVMYLTGARYFSGVENIFKKPFHTIGAAGTAILAMIFTYEHGWNDIGWRYYRHSHSYGELAAIPDYILAITFVVAAIVLLVKELKAGEWHKLLLGSFPLLAIVCFLLVMWTGGEEIGMIVFNIYLLVLGVGTIVYGARKLRLSAVNGGMFIIAALIIARFFDVDLGFVLRGVVFILLGIGFLAANIIFGRKMKKQANNE